MAYQVTIESSGHQFEADEGEAILAAALRQGVNFPYGCRNGVCCNCLGIVTDGAIDYPEGLPLALPEEDHARGEALFCKAVAKSDLVLNVAEIVGVDVFDLQILPAKVIQLNRLADDVMEMHLQLPETSKMPFHAGQYIEIVLPDGRKRAFSVANAPNEQQRLELHLRHVPGGIFTDQVFNAMQERALLRVEGPHGSFFIRNDVDAPLLLIGGGTGFAPLKAMVEQLIAEGNQNPIYLYWGVRSKKDLYHAALAEEWHKNGHVTFVPVLSQPIEEDHWQGRTGYVHHAVLEDFADLSEFDVYMSGPPPMIDSAKVAFKEKGVPDDQIFSDSFDYSADALAGIES